MTLIWKLTTVLAIVTMIALSVLEYAAPDECRTDACKYAMHY